MKWEIQKLRSRKINFLPPLLFLLILMIPLLIQLTISQNERDEQKYRTVEASLVSDTQEIERLKQNNGNANRIETLEKKLTLYNQLLDSMAKNHYFDRLRAESDLAKIDYEDMLASNQIGKIVTDQKILIAKLDYFIEKEKVIFEPIQTQRLPLVNYLIYFSQFIPFIAIWGILLLFMTKFLTDEYTDKTIAWNWVVPRNPYKILKQKSLIYWFWMSLSLLLPLTLVSGLISLWNGLGDSQYPLFFIDNQQNVTMKFAYQYLLQLFVGIFLLVIFLTAMCAFIATICHNYPLTLGISFGLSLISNGLSNDILTSNGFYPGNFFNMPKFIAENHSEQIYPLYISLIVLSLVFALLLKITILLKEKGRSTLLFRF